METSLLLCQSTILRTSQLFRMRLIHRDRHLRIILARINLHQPMAISPLMESAHLIDLCRLMESPHHTDLHL